MRKRLMFTGTLLAAVMAAIAATSAPAWAETCGDASNDDLVSVTDGVQALRAAADLSSTCEEGCDVDGNGTVTVSDGVNILRKAVGLPIVDACDFTAQEANGSVNPSLSIFDVMSKVPGIGSASASAAAAPCENDGTVATTPVGNAQSVTTFTNCLIQGAILDGTTARAVLGQGVALGFQDFSITKVATGKTLNISGQLGVTAATNGKRIVGKLTVTRPNGGFTLDLERILLTGDGSVRQGVLTLDFSQTTEGKILGIRITFDDGDELPVTAQLRNQKVRQFLLLRATRLLQRAPG